MTMTLPRTNFSCTDRRCAEEVSYPADMMYWWPGRDGYPAGWYCEYCMEEMAPPGVEWGDFTDLDKYLTGQADNLSAIQLVRRGQTAPEHTPPRR